MTIVTRSHRTQGGVVLVAAILLLAGGCGGDSNDAASEPDATVTITEETSPSTSSASPAEAGQTSGTTSSPQASPTAPDAEAGATAFPPVIDGPATNLNYFASPTGNIHCYLSRQYAECMVREQDYPVPPEQPGCNLDWSGTFWVDTEHAGYGSCRGDALDADSTLPYGSTSVVGRMACQSRETGMYCWDTQGGHGFRAARASYDIH